MIMTFKWQDMLNMTISYDYGFQEYATFLEYSQRIVDREVDFFVHA